MVNTMANDFKKIGLLLSLIGGILIVVFGLIGLIQGAAFASAATFFNPLLGAIISIVLGAIIILLSIKKFALSNMVLGIILIVLGIITFSFAGILVLIGGILVIIAK